MIHRRYTCCLDTESVAKEEIKKCVSCGEFTNGYGYLGAEGVPLVVEAQYRDNLRWIKEAGQHHLVVGSQARILYTDRVGRTRLALAFNSSVADGTLQVMALASRARGSVVVKILCY
jgi:hypothetical protein